MEKTAEKKSVNELAATLEQVAALIDEITAARRVPDGVDRREFTDFLVPLDLLHRLHGHADELRLLAAQSSI